MIMGIFSRFTHKKDKSLNISSPRSYTLHGVRIHKLTVAKYVEWLKIADDLPEIIFGTAFPNCSNMSELINKLATLDKEAVLQLIGRLLTIVPTEACRLIANLLDIDESRLLDVDSPEPLSLNELMEIIVAFAQMNDYSDFFMNVQLLKKTFQRMSDSTQELTGSNAG